MKKLRNKKNDFTKILITGAGSGLGKFASIALAELGFHIFANVEYESEIEDFQKIIISKSLKIDVFCFNILDENARKMISSFDVDILICNAAIGDSGSVAEVSVDRIRKVFDTNAFAHLDCIQLALENMILKKKAGRIIILSSLVRSYSYAFSFSLLCF